jgi:hypothetical protein
MVISKFIQNRRFIDTIEANKYSRVATIRSLGRNYIAQHRFKEALDLALKHAKTQNYYLMSNGIGKFC